MRGPACGEGVDALWFDSDGCGPYPPLGDMQLTARWFSSYHPRYGVDDMTVKVSLEAPVLGGLMMSAEQAREVARQLVEAADGAEAELARLRALKREDES